MQRDLFGLDHDQLLNDIRNHYWRIRNARKHDQAVRRRYYRKIQKIKAALIDDGFDPELLRLYCRQFASLDKAAISRYQAFLQENDTRTKKTQSA